jgi:hypothetical protein
MKRFPNRWPVEHHRLATATPEKETELKRKFSSNFYLLEIHQRLCSKCIVVIGCWES